MHANESHFIRRRHFHIVNEANGSVLTVHRGDPKPGVQIHVDKPRPDRAPHQIWYFDLEGVIRCKLNDFAIHGKGNICRLYRAYI